MKKILIISLLATLLWAQNPRVYSAIGDEIYNNVDAIENLVSLSEYKADEDKIQKYVKEVRLAKDVGYKIQARDKDANPAKYLKTLRELIKINNYFIKKVESSFELAIKNENSELFMQMLNAKLLNTKAKKQEILTYYLSHQDEVEVSEIIQGYLDEDTQLKKQKESWSQSAKQKEQARIKRLRELDKSKQEALEKQLADEVIQKKKDIRTNQKKELSIK